MSLVRLVGTARLRKTGLGKRHNGTGDEATGPESEGQAGGKTNQDAVLTSPMASDVETLPAQGSWKPGLQSLARAADCQAVEHQRTPACASVGVRQNMRRGEMASKLWPIYEA